MLTAPLKAPASVIRSTAELLRPPRRMRPSAAAEAYLRTEKGAWDPALTPMMVEPLDLLSSREYTGIVFVGPARSGKTMSLLLAGISYVVTCAPGDMLVVQMSQDTARDFSRLDLDRAIRHSPELASRLSPRARDDNTFDKFWRSGIVLKLGWPAVSQLSSKTLRYVLMTDYDRPANRDDVDGEGPLWDLGAKRIETYMSRGKVLAESSPGGEYLDAQWKPSTPHEAPPAQGILELYNRGTRARWVWPCLECGEYFPAEPGLGNFELPPFEELEERVQREDLSGLADRWSKVVCRSCGALHELHQRPAMNARGRWLHEGQRLEGGAIVGDRRRTQIASYWLGGVAAAYQRWDSILLKYLQALRSYVATKDESPLKATTNTDQAAPYLPRVAAKKRSAEHLLARLDDWPRGAVPAKVRFLTAAVDVQGNRFVVQVYGWGPGLECWVVDRFVVTSSKRKEGDRTAALDPASYAEDWDVLLDAVVQRRYPMQDAPSRELEVALTCCDSGGREGVTEKAYEFWRRLRATGYGRRFVLVKGDGNMNAPRVRETWPDSTGRRDRTLAKGDVPVWRLNVNVFKDGIVGDLARDIQGPGYVHVARWMEPEFFQELMAETRTEKGWTKANSSVRNEAFDLHVYARAACVLLDAESIDWDRPPAWAVPPQHRPEPAAPPPRGRRVRSRGIH
jgi:phage terminase large subunit GpA-like protein